MQIYDFKVRLEELKEKFSNLEKFKNAFFQNYQNIISEQSNPDFWSDMENVKHSNKTKKNLEKKLEKFNFIDKSIVDLDTMIELEAENVGSFTEEEIKIAIQTLQNNIDILWVDTLLVGEYDHNSAFVTLHSGAGGEEAQDWAEMLSRMYLRYAEIMNYDTQIVDKVAGDGAGVKSITLLVDGPDAYGYLKAEKGVHRLVRLSPFDANNRRHTSFASVEISPVIEENNKIQIDDKDVKIDTYKSSGAGGQYVNKTESAIRITHIPTGIVVCCQNERSQIKNKEMALKMLQSKLIEKEEQKKFEEKQKLLGENKKIEWGSQIRSYILHPYNLVKDHRTELSTVETTKVLDGEIQPFIIEYLKNFN